MNDYSRKRRRRTRKRFEIPLNMRQHGAATPQKEFDPRETNDVTRDPQHPNPVPRYLDEANSGEKKLPHTQTNNVARAELCLNADDVGGNPSGLLMTSDGSEQINAGEHMHIHFEDFAQCEERGSGSEHERDDNRNDTEQSTIRNFSSPFDNWTVILFLLLVAGKLHFTREQYDYIRVIILCMKETSNLRIQKEKLGKLIILDESGHTPRNMLLSSSTVYRLLKPSVRMHLGPRCFDIIYEKNSKKYRNVVDKEKPRSREETRIRIVPVSEHARMDVSFPPFLNATKETAVNFNRHDHVHGCNELNGTSTLMPGVKHWDCIEDLPLVANRECYSANISIEARRNREHITPWHTLDRAYFGDIIGFKLLGRARLSTDLLETFRATSNENELLIGGIVAVGIATTIDTDWENIHAKRDRNLLMRIFRALNEKLRDGGSHIVLSTKRTVNRRQQLLGAGDTLAVLERSNGENTCNFIVLVNRFNVPNGEPMCTSFTFPLRPN